MCKETDILITGGGMAGICAALAAAESGKNVVLLEKSSFIGGNATKSNVGTICGAYYRSVSENILPAGNSFTRNFIKDLQESHQIKRPVNYHNGLYIIPYEWSVLLELLNHHLSKWKNIEVICNAEVIGVDICDKKIDKVYAKLKDGEISFQVDSLADCSGHSIISQMANLDHISSEHYQAAAQVFRLSGVSSTSEFSLNMAIKKVMMTLMDQKKWPESFKIMSVVPGSLRENKVDLKLTLPETITDKVMENSELTVRANKYVKDIFPALAEQIESLHDAAIEMVFPEPGVRVLKRSQGTYTLTEEDVVKCRKDVNGVAVGVWPIEYWKTNGDVEMVYFDPEDGYLIPAGCLQSDQVDNLFFAGKNISATDRAIASARVIGTCIQTGYAAGKLSACAGKNERNKMVDQLHQELRISS